MAAADAFGRVMLELMERVLSSSSESRSQENIERILPVFRTRTPLFYNLSTGKRKKQNVIRKKHMALRVRIYV